MHDSRLTSADIKAIRTLRAHYMQRQHATRNRPHANYYGEEYLPPELYVAKTPTGGIRGLVSHGTATSTATLDDRPGYADCQIFRVVWNEQITVPHLEPVYATTRQVLNASLTDIAEKTWIIVARDKFGNWWALVSAGTPRKLVRITHKFYPLVGYRLYAWIAVRDSDNPLALTFYTGPGTSTSSSTAIDTDWGGPGHFPAYDINDVDYPVPYIVYLTKGRGDYWLIDGSPRVEIVRVTSLEPIEDIFFPGVLEIWDQVAKTFVDTIPVLIVDANA